MIIELKNVSKKFGSLEIIKSINVKFEETKIYGIIGKNGCGKSVLLKMICGFYKPSSGEVLFNHENIIKNKVFAPDTRAVIENPSFLPNLTGQENLKLLASIQNKISDEIIEKTLKDVNLWDEKDKKYSTYSLGMKQKLGIAQVLMEDPTVMIFDEPFNGIDEESKKKIRKLLKKLKDKIIIIATHEKEDIERLTNVTYEIKEGKIIQKK